jgi:hypothetical protein
MKLLRFHSDIRWCLRQASALLGEAAVAVSIDWDVQSLLKPRLTLRGRRGLDGGAPLVAIDDSPRGHDVSAGAECYRVAGVEPPLHVARISVPCATDLSDFYAVRAADYRRFYRFVRRIVRESWRSEPPIMAQADQRRLWDHTIGFLRRGRDVLRRFRIAARRGVLLQGAPGNGKTMACRWLRAQCRRHGMSWKSITPDELDQAREKHAVMTLLQPESPGLVLLDDFDILLRQRSEEGHTPQQTALLAALDGVATKAPAVYLFASNLGIHEINPAVRRPGRIDVILHFDAPDAELRRQLVVERWSEELLASIDIPRVVSDSEGWSFAELEEARKLMVLHFAETAAWSWREASTAMRNRRDACAPKRRIGFGAIEAVAAEDTPCVVAKGAN